MNQGAVEKTEPRELPAYSREQIELIKQTVAKGTTDLELKLFLYQCQRTGLDPLCRQIYAVKRLNRRTGVEEMTIQTGIDGYRVIAERTGVYAGNDDYDFDDSVKQPKWAKATVYKIVAGVRCAFSATARWDQYFPGEKQGWMWREKPHVMLGKCSEALALRKAFPADLSGLYVAEELHQAAGAGMTGQADPKQTDDGIPAQLQEQAGLLLPLIARLCALDQTLTPDGIIRAHFKTKAGKELTWSEVRDFRTAAQFKWVIGRIAAIRTQYQDLLSQHPEDESQERLAPDDDPF